MITRFLHYPQTLTVTSPAHRPDPRPTRLAAFDKGTRFVQSVAAGATREGVVGLAMVGRGVAQQLAEDFDHQFGLRNRSLWVATNGWPWHSLLMPSFYLGPHRAWLQADTWQDLIDAVESRATTESQWCELKADIPATSPGSNLELARDLASLTADGGVLIVGIRDKAETRGDVIGITDTALESLQSRINHIAASRVSPAMHVILHTIPDPANTQRSVLIVEVPGAMLETCGSAGEGRTFPVIE